MKQTCCLWRVVPPTIVINSTCPVFNYQTSSSFFLVLCVPFYLQSVVSILCDPHLRSSVGSLCLFDGSCTALWYLTQGAWIWISEKEREGEGGFYSKFIVTSVLFMWSFSIGPPMECPVWSIRFYFADSSTVACSDLITGMRNCSSRISSSSVLNFPLLLLAPPSQAFRQENKTDRNVT